MISRNNLTNFVYETMGKFLLSKAANIDNVPNSVQIRGKDEVNKVVLGVSASTEFIEEAIKEKADYLIVHHGLHFDGYVINGRLEPYENRLKLIIKNDLTLAGFHYALDAHPVIGNNIQIIEALGANNTGEPYFDGWGYVGQFDKAINIDELAKRCSQIFEHDVFSVKAGPSKIKRIGVCSGGARPRGKEALEMIDKQIDAHITGEISESNPYLAEEIQVNYLACGHYATEVFGVKALAKAIKDQFGKDLEVEFLDVPSAL